MAQQCGVGGRGMILAMPWLLGVLCCTAAGQTMAQLQMVNSVAKVLSVVDARGAVQEQLVDAGTVASGDELRYTISLTNAGVDGRSEVDAGSVVITNPIPEATEYVVGTAAGEGTEIRFSTDQGRTFGAGDELRVVRQGAAQAATAADFTTIQWRFTSGPQLGETRQVSFNVVLK